MILIATLESESILQYMPQGIGGRAQSLSLVTCRVSGTYAQADGVQLQNVAAQLAARRRSGRALTIVGSMPYLAATKELSPSVIMATRDHALGSGHISFKLTDTDYVTELANGAVPPQSMPFSMLVTWLEN